MTLPFVVRELIPILEAMDLAEEEAARTLGADDWQVRAPARHERGPPASCHAGSGCAPWCKTSQRLRSQVFWNVTLPNIRWGLMYGVILTNARAMGEFGAVSVISGNIIGKTQTLTLFVESAYKVRDVSLLVPLWSTLVHGCVRWKQSAFQNRDAGQHCACIGCRSTIPRQPSPAAVLLSFMALSTLLVKERLEQSVESESEVR